VSPLNLALLVGGLVVTGVGVARARGPWGRYQALKTQEANIARYEAWRGGLRDSGPTGASVALEMLRSELRIDAAIAIVGVVAIVAGLAVRF
jgi:hypothetical protein